MSRKSPFAVQKALQGIGEPKSVEKLRSGDLLVETKSAAQSKSYLLPKTFLNFPLQVAPHSCFKRVPKTSSSVLAVSTSTQVNLLMPTSSTTASISETRTPIPTSIAVPPSIIKVPLLRLLQVRI
ncbi:hypothetical protein TNCV_230921 [Trichonephila clavipes]|nr:hypothetical protein TNCV_230921 [Trichonephila clavipes]